MVKPKEPQEKNNFLLNEILRYDDFTRPRRYWMLILSYEIISRMCVTYRYPTNYIFLGFLYKSS